MKQRVWYLVVLSGHKTTQVIRWWGSPIHSFQLWWDLGDFVSLLILNSTLYAVLLHPSQWFCNLNIKKENKKPPYFWNQVKHSPWKHTCSSIHSELISFMHFWRAIFCTTYQQCHTVNAAVIFLHIKAHINQQHKEWISVVKNANKSQ